MPTFATSRFIMGLPLAAGIALGLALLMNQLTTVDFVDPEPRELVRLDRITPEPPPEVSRIGADEPSRLDRTAAPPPMPRLTAQRGEIDLGRPEITGAAPTELEFDGAIALPEGPVAVPDQQAKPLAPPVPVFPPRLVSRGVEGRCEVRFDVDVRGRPMNIAAQCNNPGFISSAERAVADVQFAPKIVGGRAVERRGVVYPIDYRIGD